MHTLKRDAANKLIFALSAGFVAAFAGWLWALAF